MRGPAPDFLLNDAEPPGRKGPVTVSGLRYATSPGAPGLSKYGWHPHFGSSPRGCLTMAPFAPELDLRRVGCPTLTTSVGK